MASPIVHLRNVDGSSGGRLCAALRPLLPSAFGTPFSVTSRRQQLAQTGPAPLRSGQQQLLP